MANKIFSIGLIGMFFSCTEPQNKIVETNCDYCYSIENYKDEPEKFISALLQDCDLITQTTYYKMESEYQIKKAKFLMSENVKKQIHEHSFNDLKLPEILSEAETTLNYANKIMDSIQKNSK